MGLYTTNNANSEKLSPIPKIEDESSGVANISGSQSSLSSKQQARPQSASNIIMNGNNVIPNKSSNNMDSSAKVTAKKISQPSAVSSLSSSHQKTTTDLPPMKPSTAKNSGKSPKPSSNTSQLSKTTAASKPPRPAPNPTPNPETNQQNLPSQVHQQQNQKSPASSTEKLVDINLTMRKTSIFCLTESLTDITAPAVTNAVSNTDPLPSLKKGSGNNSLTSVLSTTKATVASSSTGSLSRPGSPTKSSDIKMKAQQQQMFGNMFCTACGHRHMSSTVKFCSEVRFIYFRLHVLTFVFYVYYIVWDEKDHCIIRSFTKKNLYVFEF
jgi:hypothetical protein